MAFRLLRICSEESTFEKRIQELKSNFLLPRNYHAKVIDGQFSQIRNLPGENFTERRIKALEKKIFKQSEKKDRVIAPMDYNPLLPKISDVFTKHFKAMVFKKPGWKKCGTGSTTCCPYVF